MAFLGVVGAFLIVFIGTGISVNMSYVLIGTFLCSVVYTLLGIAIASKYRDLDDYFVPILAVLVISLLPFAHYHNLISGSWAKLLYAIPSYPALYFLQAGFEPVPKDALMWSGFALILWSSIAYYLAKIQFYKYAVEGLR